jgi:uncharacterized protein
VNTAAAEASVGDRRGRPRRAGALIALVRGYQLLRAGRPSGCRFVPSCSEFAVEALETHGALRGTRLVVGRLVRCHPWGGHGVDPVPSEGAPCNR